MAGLPPIDAALLPPDVRKAGPKAEQAYQTALAFESVLTQQLTQSLASTVSDTGDDEDAGDASTSLTATLIPDALSQGLSASGGLGLARQLYEALGGGGTGSKR
jgi:Rod binding domain-containing protein